MIRPLGLALLFVLCTQTAQAAEDASASDPAMKAIQSFISEQKEAKAIDTSLTGWKRRLPKPPQVEFDPEATYYWELETNLGEIVVRLLPKTAPMHVSSTIYLTELGFYDDVVFHRVIPGFMAQGGDPTGTGSGGPGYQYAGEFPSGGPTHDGAGTLSMANAGPGTDGSQFFITFRDTGYLDGKHTVFGKLRAGKQALKKIESEGSASGKTKSKVEIVKAKIRVEK